MPGLTRDYMSLYVQLLRWLLTQQLEHALVKHGRTVPTIGHDPSAKARWLATSSYCGQRRSRTTAETVSPDKGRGLKRTRADGALP